MKWEVKLKPVERCATRTRSMFLWLPRRIGSEVRWLEYAYWREQHYQYMHAHYWVPIYWLTPKEIWQWKHPEEHAYCVKANLSE